MIAAIGLAATVIGLGAANAALPTRDLAGAARIIVVCRAVAEDPDASARLHDGFCARVAARVRSGCSLPVTVATFGDAAMFDLKSLVLLVNVAARTDGGDRRISFSLRAWRAIAGEENDLFGAPPRSVPVSANDSGPELDAAIAAALDDILPRRRG